MRKYRLGAMGRSVTVPLKGRAWIAADTYQIVRLETQMLAPVPEIHLAADSTVIEYGPVHFRERNMDMWLPQSADVYSDWRGRRFHRRQRRRGASAAGGRAPLMVADPRARQE